MTAPMNRSRVIRRALAILSPPMVMTKDLVSQRMYASESIAKQEAGLIASRPSMITGLRMALGRLESGTKQESTDEAWYYVALDIVRAIDGSDGLDIKDKYWF